MQSTAMLPASVRLSKAEEASRRFEMAKKMRREGAAERRRKQEAAEADGIDEFGARRVDSNYQDDEDEETTRGALQDDYFIDSPRAEMQRQKSLGEAKMSGYGDNLLGTDPMFRAPSEQDVIMENNVQSFISGMATDYNAMSITFKRNDSLPKGTPPTGAAPNPFASGASNPFASDTSMFDQTWSGSAQKFGESDDEMFED